MRELEKIFFTKKDKQEVLNHMDMRLKQLVVIMVLCTIVTFIVANI